MQHSRCDLYYFTNNFLILMEKLIPIPEGFEIQENPQGVVITHRWYKPVVWFLIFFAMFWNGFMFFWMTAPTPWFFKAFGLIHLGVGIGLIWYIACLFKNKTEIVITPENFAFRHTPIPFIGHKNRVLNRPEIWQVFVKQTISNGKNSTSINYELHLLNPSKKSEKLLSFSDPSQTLFIKRKIEAYMQIQPMPIEGEFLG